MAMCAECGGDICAHFDLMIEQIQATMGGDIGLHRRIHPTNVAKSTGQTDSNLFAELIEKAAQINMTPQELEAELCKRTGFPDAVSGWIREKKTPNGLVRKIILGNVENILRARGANPARSASELVAA